MPELMKGHTWADRKHKVQYPVWVEPKVDEIRVHVVRDETSVIYLSYAGKPLFNLERMSEFLFDMMQANHLWELDCGVQINDNFADTYKWVRSSKGAPKVELRRFVLHLYDIPTTPVIYAQRKDKLSWLTSRYSPSGWELKVLPHYIAQNDEEVEERYATLREYGYEGIMVKDPAGLYSRGKRTDAWLKLKPDADADGTIVGFVQAVCGKDQPEKGLKKGDLLGRAGAIEVLCEDGSRATPHGIPHQLGVDMLLHPERYLGQWCEFKYMERDRQGGYRHPVFNRLREAKA